MKTISVSVIIPAYNAAITIAQAVESAINQTWSNIEIIVIDDGSTDNTQQVLKPYIDSEQIQYVYQDNKGCGAARNTGIQISNGKYIAMLDADDWWDSKKIEKQLHVLEHTVDSVMCYTDSNEVISTNNEQILIRKRYAGRLYSGSVLIPLVFKNFITLSSVLIRADVLKKVHGFTEDYDMMMFADYELWLRLATKGLFIGLPAPLVYYRTKPAPSRSQKVQNYRQIIRVFGIGFLKSSWKRKPYYAIGFLLNMIRWTGHNILSFLGL